MSDDDAYAARTMVRPYGAPIAQHVAQQQADIALAAGFPQIQARRLRVKGEIARLAGGQVGVAA